MLLRQNIFEHLIVWTTNTESVSRPGVVIPLIFFRPQFVRFWSRSLNSLHLISTRCSVGSILKNMVPINMRPSLAIYKRKQMQCNASGTYSGVSCKNSLVSASSSGTQCRRVVVYGPQTNGYDRSAAPAITVLLEQYLHLDDLSALVVDSFADFGDCTRCVDWILCVDFV